MRFEYLSLLRNEYTFAFNKIYRLFPKTDWRPSFYMIIDETIARDIKEELLQSELPRIYAGNNVNRVLGDDKRIRYIHRSFFDKKTELPLFQPDLRRGPGYACYTVTYDAFQLAWHMGFREFYTLGIDGKYNLRVLGEVDVKEPKKHVANVSAANSYFDADLFRDGETMVLPLEAEQRLAYISAKNFIEKNNGKIYNAAPDSPMELFDRCDLREIL